MKRWGANATHMYIGRILDTLRVVLASRKSTSQVLQRIKYTSFYIDVHFIYMQGVGPSTKKSIQKAHSLKNTFYIGLAPLFLMTLDPKTDILQTFAILLKDAVSFTETFNIFGK